MSDNVSENVESSKSGLFIILGLILAAVGIGLSYYSLTHHLALKFGEASNFGCNINDVFSCDKVAESKYSEIFGIPLGVYGMGFFGSLLVLLLTSVFKPEHEKDVIPFYKYLVFLGGAASIGLFILSKFVVDALCPTCIGVYAVSIAQVLMVIFVDSPLEKGVKPTSKNLYNGATYAGVVLFGVIAIYQFVKPTSHDNPNRMAHVMSDEEKAGGNTAQTQSMLAEKIHDIKLSKSAYSGLGEDYRMGADDAKVVIHEFADYQCPACQRITETLQIIKQEFGSKVLIVYRNYPLDEACNSGIKGKFHEYACEAAVITRCAGRLGKFWPLYYQVFSNQADINSDNLVKWAKGFGLSEGVINECKNSKDILAKIKDDISVANGLGVDSTPTLFINGRKFIANPTYQNLRYQIEKLLNQ